LHFGGSTTRVAVGSTAVPEIEISNVPSAKTPVVSPSIKTQMLEFAGIDDAEIEAEFEVVVSHPISVNGES
jgi:hypothetical protein